MVMEFTFLGNRVTLGTALSPIERQLYQDRSNNYNQASAETSGYEQRGWNPFKSAMRKCGNLAISLGTFVFGDPTRRPALRTLTLTNNLGEDEDSACQDRLNEHVKRADLVADSVADGTGDFKTRVEGPTAVHPLQSSAALRVRGQIIEPRRMWFPPKSKSPVGGEQWGPVRPLIFMNYFSWLWERQSPTTERVTPI